MTPMMSFTRPVALGIAATLVLLLGVACVIAAGVLLLDDETIAAWCLFSASLMSFFFARLLQSASNRALAAELASWESQLKAQFRDTVERMQP